ncbi:MAG: universal stress protein [Candidatus Scalindua sp.]|nr:universal stress protein [Candidatus Scalindua sp.]
MVAFQKILCPVDFSECSREALKYALHLTEIAHSQLIIISIIDGNIYEFGVGTIEKKDSRIKLMSNQELVDVIKVKLLERIPEKMRDKVCVMVKSGIPDVEIVKTAKEKDIDLIVMGTHGRSGILYFLVGSVAEKVSRKAPCPVMTVKVSQIRI